MFEIVIFIIGLSLGVLIGSAISYYVGYQDSMNDGESVFPITGDNVRAYQMGVYDGRAGD